MKIAILYICTGRYTIFWREFYTSAEKFFFPGCEKNYYVFTDSHRIFGQDENEHITIIPQNDLGWPGNTLFRFKIFKNIEHLLKQNDYIFFINANMIFVDYVGKEIIPDEDKIIVTTHPGYFNKPRKEFTYETNPDSLAYIPENKGEVYVCGGFNGGYSKGYLELIESLSKNIQDDYDRGIIAKWHDESHINHYIINNNKYKLLSPSYCYPQGEKLPFKKKILVRDKNNYGGHDYLRGITDKRIGFFKKTKMNLSNKLKQKISGLIRLLYNKK